MRLATFRCPYRSAEDARMARPSRNALQLHEARQSQDFTRIALLERALAFNASRHVLHSLYRRNLAPGGGGEPTGELAQAIDGAFGSCDALRRQFTQVAMTITGSGWAALVRESLSKRLATVQLHDHQLETVQGAVQLLVLDAWEHAYYLQYLHEKAKSFEASWNLLNWRDVAQRLQAAPSADLRITQSAA
jgi:Fe-Mn family superoxide dismutase